jgi:hypothetical protein
VHAPVDLDRIAPSAAVPNAFLGGGVFTESRVIPPNTGQTAPPANAYPYRAVGKLFFFNPRTRQEQFCGAATNGPRVIVTAAQCIAKGSRSADQRFYYTNFCLSPPLTTAPHPTANGRLAITWSR